MVNCIYIRKYTVTCIPRHLFLSGWTKTSFQFQFYMEFGSLQITKTSLPWKLILAEFDSLYSSRITNLSVATCWWIWGQVSPSSSLRFPLLIRHLTHQTWDGSIRFNLCWPNQRKHWWNYELIRIDLLLDLGKIYLCLQFTVFTQKLKFRIRSLY